ncbi:MAG: lipoyl(octanoyl) transferase LipB [Acidobacteria bacterium]|nr:lipoyl(octanoyl) transferase LipB [Acidobacteriota bacterium]
MPNCLIVDLGFIGYADAFELQKRIVAARKADAIGDVLLLCEHPHVITLGRSGKRENLLASERVLLQIGVEFHAANRGGDITYHGPGQIVGYSMIQLAAIRRDVVWYVRMLEEVMIRTCTDFGIAARREEGKTGAWIDPQGAKTVDSPRRAQSSQSAEVDAAEKIGAIGVHISRWVTSHGFAFNVSTDLRYFELIVPCGIAERKTTSLEKVLGRAVRRNEAAPKIVEHFGEVFGREPRQATREELFAALERFEQQPVAVPGQRQKADSSQSAMARNTSLCSE